MIMNETLQKIEARMANGEPFRFRDLHSLANSMGADWRIADRAIQRWRKRGWISFVRVGRDSIWSLTEAGRSALAGS